jgi:hypothetical protein
VCRITVPRISGRRSCELDRVGELPVKRIGWQARSVGQTGDGHTLYVSGGWVGWGSGYNNILIIHCLCPRRRFFRAYIAFFAIKRAMQRSGKGRYGPSSPIDAPFSHPPGIPQTLLLPTRPFVHKGILKALLPIHYIVPCACSVQRPRGTHSD